MPALATVWALAKGLPWKYITAALAALSLALLIWRAPWAEHRQKEKDAVAWQAEHARAEGFKANQGKLTAALVHQNAAVGAAKKDGDRRVAEGKSNLKAAVRANQGLVDQAAALRRSAGRKVGVNDPCVISNTLGNMGGV